MGFFSLFPLLYVTDMPDNQTRVSVVIPAYNEEKTIAGTINRVRTAMNKAGKKHEIIAVNDGSKDKTGAILKGLRDVVVIEHEGNKGYGASIKDGFRKAKYEWVLITDADGTYPIEDIPKLLEHVPEYDMVVGSRTKKGVKIPLLRRPAKWFLNKMANYLTRTKIPDLNSGLRVFRKDIAQRFEALFPDGFSFTATITIACLCDGYKVRYVPIEYSKREGKSSIRPLRDFIGFVQLITRMMLYFRPLRFFIPISLIVLLFSVGWGVKDLVQSCGEGFFACRIGSFAPIMFMFAIQIAFLGLLADLIIQRTKATDREIKQIRGL